MRRLLPLLLLAGSLAGIAPPGPGSQLSGTLRVFNAGSLAYPFRELLTAFAAAHPAVRPAQESSGSLEAVRKLTELGKVPDVLAVADHRVIQTLLMPDRVTWYATFASNAMGLAYSDRSAGAAELAGGTWWEILLRPEVRWGMSNPALDPNGYRTLMVFQLAERFYGRPGLAGRLRAAVKESYLRPNEAQLLGLVQAGELDYAWSYRSLAITAGLRWVSLPPEIDLSDPAQAEGYRTARVRLPGASLAAPDSVEFRGEPILYAITVPRGAPHPQLGEAFVRFVLSGEGRRILRSAGFVVLPRPDVIGNPPSGLGRPGPP